MRRIITSMLLLAVSASAALAQNDEQKFAKIDWGWHEVVKGMEAGYTQTNIFGGTQSIAIVRYNPAMFNTNIVEIDGENALGTSDAAKSVGAIAAMNASYFNMRTTMPVTYVKDNGVVINDNCKENELFRCTGMLRIKDKKGKKLDIVATDTNYEAIACYGNEAIVSGPILMTKGQTWDYYSGLDSFFTGRHPRSIMGCGSDGMVYLIVIDGRMPGQGDGATIPDCIWICKNLGLVDAINFDGGGSSAVWTKTDGVINHPSDNRKFDHEGERRIPNIIAVSAK